MGGRGRPPLQMWYTFDLINPPRAVGDATPYIVNARFACSNFITIKFIACSAAFPLPKKSGITLIFREPYIFRTCNVCYPYHISKIADFYFLSHLHQTL